MGIGDFWEAEHDVPKAFRSVTNDGPVLMFTHNPDVFPTIAARYRFSLLVAGHTHGGQVHLPLLGRPIVPSKYGERYAFGHVVEEGRHVRQPRAGHEHSPGSLSRAARSHAAGTSPGRVPSNPMAEKGPSRATPQ
jgi:hypothetical protein